MRDKGLNIETGWLPLRDSYEEAVLSWYEQIENSFRRRELESRRVARPESASPTKATVDDSSQVFD